MRMKNLFCFAVTAVVLTLAGVSCSDDSGEGGGSLPLVTIDNVRADGTSVSAVISARDAVTGAYLLYAAAEPAPASEEQVLADGTPFDPTAPASIVIEELDYDTAYTIVAAVKDEAGHTASASVEITTGKDPATDLGAGANCYIVPAAGLYSFVPEKVDGSAIEGIASAGWIWATKIDEADMEQKLLGDISYADGKIRFTATGERGNAVVGAFDKTGRCIWVWLLWCSEQPGEMEYASGARFLDRAIGATSANPADGTKTWGDILYQWGRNVPLFSGYVDEWGESEVFNEARKWTVMNPQYGFAWGVEKHLTTIEGSLAAPTTFFADPDSSPSNWIAEDRTLWGKVKTNYDPCPAGYRLPAIEDWGTLVEDLVILDDLSAATYTYNGHTAHYPAMNNGRMYDTGENIIGHPGFSVWNCEYKLHDPMGFTAILDQLPYTLEQLIEMGYISYYPTRTYSSYTPGTVKGGSDVVANNSFAFTARCVKEK